MEVIEKFLKRCMSSCNSLFLQVFTGRNLVSQGLLIGAFKVIATFVFSVRYRNCFNIQLAPLNTIFGLKIEAVHVPR